MNRITATGRVVRDCVMHENTMDKVLCKFILACKGDYYVENKIHTDFIRCVAWEKTAEFLINNVKKGDLIAISGTLQSREYENHEESKKEIVWEIKVDKVEFLAKNEPKEETKTEPSQADIDPNLPF